MSEKIPALDYLGVAKDLMERYGTPATSVDVQQAAFGAAQANALIAIAEQLRVANLLTYAQFEANHEDGIRTYIRMEAANKLRMEAFEALGLKEDDFA